MAAVGYIYIYIYIYIRFPTNIERICREPCKDQEPKPRVKDQESRTQTYTCMN